MTLIIGLFIRDSDDNKDIIFASDGRAVKYKNNKKIGQCEDVEKIRKLTPKICMGYAGKNSELFEDVYDELKNKTPKKIKNKLGPFAKRLHEIILKMLKTKKHREIEKELKRSKQLYQKFIVGGVFHNKLMLITINPDDNYKIKKDDAPPTFPDIARFVAGLNKEIQKETMAILDKKLGSIQSYHIRRYDEIKNVIRCTISEIATLYPDLINNHIFIRRLTRNFKLERYIGYK